MCYISACVCFLRFPCLRGEKCLILTSQSLGGDLNECCRKHSFVSRLILLSREERFSHLEAVTVLNLFSPECNASRTRSSFLCGRLFVTRAIKGVWAN